MTWIKSSTAAESPRALQRSTTGCAVFARLSERGTVGALGSRSPARTAGSVAAMGQRWIAPKKGSAFHAGGELAARLVGIRHVQMSGAGAMQRTRSVRRGSAGQHASTDDCHAEHCRHWNGRAGQRKEDDCGCRRWCMSSECRGRARSRG